MNSSLEIAIDSARKQTSTTHNTPEALDASSLMCFIIWHGINGYTKDHIFSILNTCSIEHPEIKELTSLSAEWRTTPKELIRSLPGRALWSLEAALWSVYNTASFKDAVVLAVSLGGDADTIGAITGQIAGSIYGFESIPERWIKGLCHSEEIMRKAQFLFDEGKK